MAELAGSAKLANVSRIYSERPVSEKVDEALRGMCEKFVSAIRDAKDAGVPQGLIVAVLAAHAHEETGRMLG